MKVWAAWEEGRIGDPVGLGAVCQVAFVNAMDTKVTADSGPGDPLREVASSAQLWRARASLAATMNGELNTTAMLLAPMAMQAFAQGYSDSGFGNIPGSTRLLVMRSSDAVSKMPPGGSLSVLRRASYEKQGWILWRQGRYREARSAYEDALSHTTDVSRDRVRVDAGLLLVSLGIEEDEFGSFDGTQAALCLRDLEARALDGQWIDVALRLGANADGLERSEFASVQSSLLWKSNRFADLGSEPAWLGSIAVAVLGTSNGCRSDRRTQLVRAGSRRTSESFLKVCWQSFWQSFGKISADGRRSQ